MGQLKDLKFVLWIHLLMEPGVGVVGESFQRLIQTPKRDIQPAGEWRNTGPSERKHAQDFGQLDECDIGKEEKV